METVALILSIVSVIGLAVLGLIIREYVRSYLSEKGKNTASKEDIAHLTELVEGVRSLHVAEIERLKTSLLAEGQVTERRRRVYEEMCDALRVFISGHDSTPEAKQRFHKAYAATWLWASDDVLKSLNHFLGLQARHTARLDGADNQQREQAYAAIVIAMRSDVGFQNTVVTATDYKFVQFV